MGHFVSPHFHTDFFGRELNTEDKIMVFADRVYGWQLDIAHELIVQNRHAGFAVLGIVMSYFEMVGKYEAGYGGTGKSRQYFESGVRSVFPDVAGLPTEAAKELMSRLYEGVRCGMYHQALTGSGVRLSGDFEHPLAVVGDHREVRVNPRKLVESLLAHFGRYVGTLLDLSNVDGRNRFLRRFNRIG